MLGKTREQLARSGQRDDAVGVGEFEFRHASERRLDLIRGKDRREQLARGAAVAAALEPGRRPHLARELSPGTDDGGRRIDERAVHVEERTAKRAVEKGARLLEIECHRGLRSSLRWYRVSGVIFARPISLMETHLQGDDDVNRDLSTRHGLLSGDVGGAG